MLSKSEEHARLAQKLGKFSFKWKLDIGIVVFVFAHLKYLLFFLSLSMIIHPNPRLYCSCSFILQHLLGYYEFITTNHFTPILQPPCSQNLTPSDLSLSWDERNENSVNILMYMFVKRNEITLEARSVNIK